jgi:hypothetical protein
VADKAVRQVTSPPACHNQPTGNTTEVSSSETADAMQSCDAEAAGRLTAVVINGHRAM